jgi:transcriptional regulator with XRE-family HTH domain
MADDQDRPGADVGDRLRRARTAAGLTTRRLAAVTGVSQAMISTIENGRTTPSIATLFKLADALGVRAQALLPEAGADEVTIVREDTSVPVRMSDDSPGLDGRLLVSGADRLLEVVEYRLAPGVRHGAFAHDGEELLRVGAGVLEVALGDPVTETHRLGPGELIHYPSRIPHRWTAVGDEEAVVLLVTASPLDPHHRT